MAITSIWSLSHTVVMRTTVVTCLPRTIAPSLRTDERGDATLFQEAVAFRLSKQAISKTSLAGKATASPASEV